MSPEITVHSFKNSGGTTLEKHAGQKNNLYSGGTIIYYPYAQRGIFVQVESYPYIIPIRLVLKSTNKPTEVNLLLEKNTIDSS